MDQPKEKAAPKSKDKNQQQLYKQTQEMEKEAPVAEKVQKPASLAQAETKSSVSTELLHMISEMQDEADEFTKTLDLQHF